MTVSLPSSPSMIKDWLKLGSNACIVIVSFPAKPLIVRELLG